MSAAQLSPWGGTAKWFVLLTGLALTLGAWHWLQADDASRAQERFEIEASEALEAIRSRMHAVSQLLRGGGGLFAVSEKVSRTVWRQYVESLQFEQSYPGIQGIGYALHIPPAALEQHQRHDGDFA